MQGTSTYSTGFHLLPHDSAHLSKCQYFCFTFRVAAESKPRYSKESPCALEAASGWFVGEQKCVHQVTLLADQPCALHNKNHLHGLALITLTESLSYRCGPENGDYFLPPQRGVWDELVGNSKLGPRGSKCNYRVCRVSADLWSLEGPN